MPAPTLETPPNPVEPPSPQPGTPAKVRTGRFGELEEHELIHLLDTLDDERASARFRESIYISVFVYIVIGWFLFYGPRVLFHQPRLVNPSEVLKQRELTNLAIPADIAKALQHAPKAKTAPPVKPQMENRLDTKTLEAMRKAAPAPKPLPATPQPQPTATPPPVQQSQPTPQPPLQQPIQKPAPPVLATIPDAPKPGTSFATPSRSAGDTIRQAVEGAARNRGGGSDRGDAIAPSRMGAGTGVDILSDTMGVNFDPYLKRIMRQIYNTWIPLIPEEARPPLNKQGVTQIRFIILPDGKIGGMILEGSTHDDALNRAAWGSITGVGQFPSLPAEFHGPNLTLRIHYLVNQKQE